MKQIVLGLLLVSFMSSCLKSKDYDCECTYVPMAAWHPPGTPNKVETVKVSGRIKEDAASNCSIDNEGKYFTQHYDGTCILK
ncbi:MAG: hypothetical protein IPK62_00655 [Bacteroidetes bacterium]|nr:hypothetical protein [Bacteroidota bacterium]MBK8143587.1 hypothetical protein [Bacteroidota bacterium]